MDSMYDLLVSENIRLKQQAISDFELLNDCLVYMKELVRNLERDDELVDLIIDLENRLK
jgi:hypothetical protein